MMTKEELFLKGLQDHQAKQVFEQHAAEGFMQMGPVNLTWADLGSEERVYSYTKDEVIALCECAGIISATVTRH